MAGHIDHTPSRKFMILVDRQAKSLAPREAAMFHSTGFVCTKIKVLSEFHN